MIDVEVNENDLCPKLILQLLGLGYDEIAVTLIKEKEKIIIESFNPVIKERLEYVDRNICR